MKQQVLVIHGGDTFETKEKFLESLRKDQVNYEKMTKLSWRENLRTDLGDQYEVVLPQMPNKHDARYEEWAIQFDKIVPYLRDGVILVGHSLGGVFLAKYLAENDIPVKAKMVCLVAAPFGDNLPEYQLFTFVPPDNFERFGKQCPRIVIYHSDDDPVVPVNDAKKYQAALPNVELQLLSGRSHIYQDHFPELVDEITAA